MSKEKGITLVSLVLTIILIMILAGVTVKITANGLLNKKDNIVNEYYSKEKNVTDQIESLNNEWSTIIN